jgi:YbbR domain-containing protein
MSRKQKAVYVVMSIILAICLYAYVISKNGRGGAPKKPQTMQEDPCPKGTYHTVVLRDSKMHKYCVKKIKK